MSHGAKIDIIFETAKKIDKKLYFWNKDVFMMSSRRPCTSLIIRLQLFLIIEPQ